VKSVADANSFLLENRLIILMITTKMEIGLFRFPNPNKNTLQRRFQSPLSKIKVQMEENEFSASADN